MSNYPRITTDTVVPGFKSLGFSAMKAVGASSVHKTLQWCVDLVNSDLVDCRDLLDYFCCLTGDKTGEIIP